MKPDKMPIEPPDALFRYEMPVEWVMAGTVPIIAGTLENALAAAMKSTLPQGHYLSNSFHVVTQIIHAELVKDKNGHPIRLNAAVHVPDPIDSDIPSTR